MNFLRTSPFGALFTAAFVLGASCHIVFLLIQIILALTAPGLFNLNGRPAANTGEAFAVVAMLFVGLMFANAGISALGSLCWLIIRRWVPTKAAQPTKA